MLTLKIDVLKPFQNVLTDVINYLPTIAGLLAFIIVAWLFIKVFLWIVKKILVKTNLDEWSKKLSETKIFGNTTINIVLTKVILNVLKWFLVLVFVMAGSNIFGMTSISDGIKSFLAYLPRLITALAIFTGGAYLGTIIKKAILGTFKSLEINGGNVVGNVVFYLIVVFLSVTALDHAGVDTSIIKSNIILLLASVFLAFTIAFGLGAKEAVSRLLYGYYSRKNIGIGDTVLVNDFEGVVVAIDNICLVLQTAEGRVVFPIKEIVDSKIVIKNK